MGGLRNNKKLPHFLLNVSATAPIVYTLCLYLMAINLALLGSLWAGRCCLETTDNDVQIAFVNFNRSQQPEGRVCRFDAITRPECRGVGHARCTIRRAAWVVRFICTSSCGLD